jgi:hypothetical protein
MEVEMKHRTALAVLTLLSIGLFTASGEDFWVKKSWTQWNKEDCKRMLENSPWAKNWSVERSNNGAASPGISGAAQAGSAGDAKEEIDYTVQLWSALPVRQALLRQEQIQKKYEKMSDEQKKEFDARAADVLGRTYDDVIVFHVTYGSNIQPYARQLEKFWQGVPAGSVPLSVYLITEHDERIIPVKFDSPKSGANEFLVYFPRMNGSEPIVRPGDKNLRLNFRNPPIGRLRGDRALIEFKVDKMMWEGKPAY